MLSNTNDSTHFILHILHISLNIFRLRKCFVFVIFVCYYQWEPCPPTWCVWCLNR